MTTFWRVFFLFSVLVLSTEHVFGQTIKVSPIHDPTPQEVESNKRIVGTIHQPASGTPDDNGYHSCDDWYPERANIPNGQKFVQTRRCSQDVDVEQVVHDAWSDGSKTHNETKRYRVSQLVLLSQESFGTSHGPIVKVVHGPALGRAVGGAKSCEHVDSDQDGFFRCHQEVEVERPVYDVRADGTTEFRETERYRVFQPVMVAASDH